MTGNKALLTYKRKRLSAHSDHDEGIILPTKIQKTAGSISLKEELEASTFNEKLKGNDLLASEYGASDVDTTQVAKVDLVKSDALQRGNSGASLITFTRRAKLKKDVPNINKESTPLSMEIKGTAVKWNRYASDSNKNGLYYKRREKSSSKSEKDMVANIEEVSLGSRSKELLQSNIVVNSSELSPIHCDQTPKPNDLLNIHSDLVECEKENPAKLTSMCSTVTVKDSDNEIVLESKQSEVGSSLGVESGLVLTKSNEKVDNAFILDGSKDVGDSPMNVEQSTAAAMEKCQFIAQANAGGKEFEWLKSPEEILQLPSRQKGMCSSTMEGVMDCRQDSGAQKSNTVQVLDLNHHYEQTPEGNIDQPIQFQERMFLSDKAERGYETQCYRPTEKRAVFTNFLGLSAPEPDAAANSIRAMGSTSMKSGLLEANHNYDGRFSSQGSVVTSTSRKQVVDNILMGSRMLNRRQGVSWGLKRHLSNWSEEELDSLWIGVRRHGRSNWNAMLRDPRLYFSEFRNAEDLAEMWDIEQSKLFNGGQVHLLNSNFMDGMVDKLSMGSCSSISGISRHFPSEFPRSRTEIQLSLGNAYLPKTGNYPHKNAFQFPDLGSSFQHPRSENSAPSSYLTNDLFWKKASTRYQRQIGVQRPSIIEGNAVGSTARIVHQHDLLPAKGNLPHWLKEVIAVPPSRLGEPPLASGALATVPTALCANPFSTDKHTIPTFPDLSEIASARDSRRGILKRSMVFGSNAGILKGADVPFPSDAPRIGRSPDTAVGRISPEQAPVNEASDRRKNFDLNKNSRDPNSKQDLVIIDSDASSEETISDDGRS